MVDSSSVLPAVSPRPFVVWLNALAGLSFIAVMVLPMEAAAAWLAGSAVHSAILGWIVAAALALPTAYWLVGRGLRNALDAERELVSGAPPRPGA
ncbi:hypothetical protein [Acuticoccus sp. I52.16.1]|uniref:hypothetical protein n=1 Tax=Acuticoccus sp. I52.16.1 TaxID=2928472 RepID=UPI001FD02A76|nr:hypothetical protein [Acuticoccus sp. I52.16.1]UOM36364.1 hypothetical protein MRB58_09310 [Acuticoccus sp. I52.16.1]